jgi:hypothetical protein
MTLYVEPPPSGQSRYGLLEAATVVDSTDPHVAFGVQWQPNCGTAHLTRAACEAGGSVSSESGVEAPGDKTVDDGVPLVVADTFTVYHLFECRPVGMSPSDLADRARTTFGSGEGRAVEAWMSTYLATHPDAVDVTPAGGAVAPLDGLGYLEQYAGANYGGQPTIHMDRDVATILASTAALSPSGGRLTTVLGSKVAAGGGYTLGDPSGAATAATDAWMYVTGAVGLWRGDILSTDPVLDLARPETLIAATNPNSNLQVRNALRVLLERPYVGGVECIVAAIKVTRSSCCEVTP